MDTHSLTVWPCRACENVTKTSQTAGPEKLLCASSSPMSSQTFMSSRFSMLSIISSSSPSPSAARSASRLRRAAGRSSSSSSLSGSQQNERINHSLPVTTLTNIHTLKPHRRAILASRAPWLPVACPSSSWPPQRPLGLLATALTAPHHRGPNPLPRTDPAPEWHGNPWTETELLWSTKKPPQSS